MIEDSSQLTVLQLVHHLLLQEDAFHIVLETILVQEITQKVLHRLKRDMTTNNDMSTCKSTDTGQFTVETYCCINTNKINSV